MTTSEAFSAPLVPVKPWSGIFRTEILLPVLVLFGFAAFITSGFGAGLEMAQPFPIYIYCSLLLILLQAYLVNFRSIPRSLYGIAAALFGIVFAADASFFANTPGNFTQSPVTYIIVDIVAVIVFATDTVQRHRGETAFGGDQLTSGPVRFYRTLATDFAGLAILFGLSSFLLDFIDTRSALRFLGVGAPNRPIAVDLNQIFGFSLPSTVSKLAGLNLALAFLMATGWLLVIVIIGAFVGVGTPPLGGTTSSSQNRLEFTAFLRTLRDISKIGFLEATYSLRSVLQIFLWLVPAFSIANFAIVSTGYFNASARATTTIGNLFNPFSASSLDNIGRGFLDLFLAIIALGAVVVTVAVAEFDVTVITNTLRQVGTFVRILSLTLIFFTLSLAVTNAATKLFGIDQFTPFQVGAATVVALGLFISNALVTTLVSRRQTTPITGS